MGGTGGFLLEGKSSAERGTSDDHPGLYLTRLKPEGLTGRDFLFFIVSSQKWTRQAVGPASRGGPWCRSARGTYPTIDLQSITKGEPGN
jgi:hypothetical protein